MEPKRIRAALFASVLTFLGSILWVVAYSAYNKAFFDQSITAPSYLRNGTVEEALRSGVFRSAVEAASFLDFMQNYARRTGVSVALEHEERLRRGALGASRARAVSLDAVCAPDRLAGLSKRPVNCGDVLIVTFVAAPRMFFIRGVGRVRDKLALRGTLAKVDIRNRQYAYFRDGDTAEVIRALNAMEGDMTRPLSRFLSVIPAGDVSRILSLGALKAIHTMPDIFQKSVSTMSVAVAHALAPLTQGSILLLYSVTVFLVVFIVRPLLFLLVDRVLDWLVGARAKGATTRIALGFGLKFIAGALFVFSPLLFYTFLVYGDLTDLVSFSDISGERVGVLERATFSLNAKPFDIDQWIAIPFAAGIVVLRIFDIIRRRELEEFFSDDWAEALGTISFSGGIVALFTYPAAIFFMLMSLPAVVFFALVSLEGPTGALFLLYAGGMAVSSLALPRLAAWRAGRL